MGEDDTFPKFYIWREDPDRWIGVGYATYFRYYTLGSGVKCIESQEEEDNDDFTNGSAIPDETSGN